MKKIIFLLFFVLSLKADEVMKLDNEIKEFSRQYYHFQLEMLEFKALKEKQKRLLKEIQELMTSL